MSTDNSSNQTLETNNSVEPENQHKSWWPLWLLGGLIILFLLMIIILRGLCSDVWYINLLQLNDKLCGGTSSLEQQLNLKDGSIRGPEIANGAVGFDQLNPEISAYLKTQINNTQNVTNNTNTTTNNAGANYFYDLNCVSTVICNTSSVEANKNIAIQSAGTLTPTAQLRSGWGQLSDLLQFQGPAGNVQSVINTGGNFGIQTPAPMAALDVNGDAIIRNHAAIGPDATLGTGSLITPLAVGPSGIPILPATPIPATRTLAVQEAYSGFPTAVVPTAYSGIGAEIYIDSTVDPGASAFMGAYSSAEVMVANGYDYPAVFGQAGVAVHSGIGEILLGAGNAGLMYNMSSGRITAGAGVNGSFVNVASGTVDYGYGLGSYMFNTGTGSVASGGGLYVARGNTSTGTIGILDGVYVHTPHNDGGGVIGNAIGLRIASQSESSGGTPITDGTNILSLDSALPTKNIVNGNNYFNADINPNFREDWETNSTSLPLALTGHTSVYHNGYIYVMGGQDSAGSSRSEVYYAKVLANGKLGAWTVSASSLPVPVMDHTSVVSNGYIYVIGGTSGVPFTAYSSVYYARINPDGSIGSWATSPNSLPLSKTNHSSIVANGYVYAIAGQTTPATLTSDVYYAKLNVDGTTGPWSTSVNALPIGVDGQTSVFANGYMYTISGRGTTDVYYSKLNPDGTNDPWALNPNLSPLISFDASAVVANGYIYNMGGRYFSAPIDQHRAVYHSRINNDGSTDLFETDFFNLSGLPVGLEGQTSVYVNGYIYTIGGATGTTPTPISDIYVVSTRRNAFAGAVDLVGLSVTPDYTPGGQVTEDAAIELVNVTAGAQFTAGDTSIFGNFNLNGEAFINSSLTVNGFSNFNDAVRMQNTVDSTSAMQILDSSGGSIVNVDTAGGYVGISNATPGYNLHVGSGSIIAGTTVARFENAGGTCDVTPNVVGAVTCTSDIRVKKNISEITDVLEKIGAISVYSYNLTAEKDDDPVHVGFLAQELEEIMPDLVKTDKDGMKSVSYAGLTPYLVQAIKQQQIQINELKNTSAGTSGGQTSVNVLAELASASAITINGDLIVNGKVEFSNSNKGTVKVKVAELKEKVLFSKQFTAIPNVVVSPNNFVTGVYKVSNVTKDSFEIELNQPQAEEVEFSWQAF